jgi:hypothetical protein
MICSCPGDLFWHLARLLNEKITAASSLSHLDEGKGEPK